MELLVVAILILLNGIFSMSEIALVSSRKFKLESEVKKGNKNAKRALQLANSPNTFLSTVQVGITLIGILTGIFSGKALTTDLAVILKGIPLVAPYADTVAVVVIVVAITYLTIVFGELIPKRLGMRFPEKISSAVARPMTLLSSLAKPLIWLLAKTNDLFLGLFGIKDQQDSFVTEEEIKSIIAESAVGGEIQQIEEDIVKRVFALGDRKAQELMTYRSDLIWLDIRDSFAEVKAKVDAEPHSFYPVCDKTIDNLLGIVSLKQLFRAGVAEQHLDLQKIPLSKPIYIPEHMAAYRVLEHFKVNNLHSAIVVDEYGSIQGIITMNDVMDELIGDTVEEGGNDYQILARQDGSFLVDGQFPYFEFVEHLGMTRFRDVGSFTTVGGLIISLSGHIPITGETVEWEGYTLEVVDMDGQRIDKVLVSKP